MPNPFDPGSCRLPESLGFPALATTSGGFAASLGRVDMTGKREEWSIRGSFTQCQPVAATCIVSLSSATPGRTNDAALSRREIRSTCKEPGASCPVMTVGGS